jgi:hypothetical protein
MDVSPFVVWGPKEANPFFSTVTDVIDRFVEIPRQDPDAPDAFRFADPGELPGILENADAKNVIERQLNFQIKAAISFEQFWQLRIEMSGTLRKEMAGLAPAQLPTTKQAVADVARRYFMSGTMSFPAEALIVSGRKPHRQSLDQYTHCHHPVPRSFSIVAASFNAKQCKLMQRKRLQAAPFYPRERSLCETVKNSAKKLSLNYKSDCSV